MTYPEPINKHQTKALFMFVTGLLLTARFAILLPYCCLLQINSTKGAIFQVLCNAIRMRCTYTSGKNRLGILKITCFPINSQTSAVDFLKIYYLFNEVNNNNIRLLL